MARKTKVVLICDMRHREDVEAVDSIELAIDGRRRKVDLCEDHLREARVALRPWLGAPRSAATGRRSTGRPVNSAAARRESAEVRRWAEANGYTLPGRGRIPAAVHDAYRAAQR